MPKIPKGSFRTDPSVRVERQETVRFDAPASKQLQSMGKQFVQIGDQLAQAKRDADSLTKAENVQKDYEKNVVSEIQTILNTSKNGEVQTADGKTRKISEAASEIITKFDTKASTFVSEDSLASESYLKYTRNDMDKLMRDVRKQENAQITSHRKKALRDFSSQSVQNFITTGNTDKALEDYGQLQDKADKSQMVVGRTYSDETLSGHRTSLALAASDALKSVGWSSEKEDELRKFIKRMPPSPVRTQAMREYDETAEKLRRKAIEQRSKDIEELVDSTDGKPKEVMQAVPKLQETMKTLLNEPLVEGERDSERINDIAKGYGTMLANGAAYAIKDKKYIGQMGTVVSKQADYLMESIENTPMVKQLGKEKVKAEILRVANEKQAILHSMLEGDTAQYAQNQNASIQYHWNSGTQKGADMAMGEMRDFWKENNIAKPQQLIATQAEARAEAKYFKDFAKGQTDMQGDLSQSRLEGMLRTRQSHSLKYIDDLIKLGGGLKSGETNVPPYLAFAARMKDRGLSKEGWAAINNRQENIRIINKLATREDEKFNKEKFRMQINNFFQGTTFGKMNLGKDDENKFLSGGIRQVFEAMAIKNMADGVENPFHKAELDLKTEFVFAEHQGSTVMLDRDYIAQYGVNDAKAKQMLKGMNKLQSFENIPDLELDMEAMKHIVDRDTIQMAEAAGKVKGKKAGWDELRNALKDDIVVVNDPHRSNAFKVYVRGNLGLKPVYVKRNGKRQEFSIKFQEYHKAYSIDQMNRAKRLEEAKQKAGFGFRGPSSVPEDVKEKEAQSDAEWAAVMFPKPKPKKKNKREPQSEDVPQDVKEAQEKSDAEWASIMFPKPKKKKK